MSISAVAVFDSSVKGTVRFTEYEHEVVISVDIKGLRPNSKHGFHVHECGDMTDKCESMCAHFNPYGKQHGGPGDKERHVGDLGNLVADKNGRAKYVQRDAMIKLRGTKCNIIGRGLIIHEDEDDLGRGGQKDSLVTGHAGKRIACAVIGYARH
jgi:Cu-Zn family superoxide dismutase